MSLFKNWNYKKKAFWSEIIYVILIAVVIPFFVGIQIWPQLSYTGSLILLNILQLPVIILFYRIYLPKTIFRGHYIAFLLLFIPFLVLYEINGRLGAILIIHTPFIPKGYQNLLMSGHPEWFGAGYLFNQTFGYTFLLLLTASALALIKELFKQQQKVYHIAYEKLKLELTHLKSQVQPHFFFNTLNNLYTLTLRQSPSAPVMIANLSEIMRYVIYESEQEKVSLDKEINFITKYLALEKLRHSDPGVIDFAVQGNPDELMIEPLLFLPLIENCFKHAFRAGLKDSKIRIIMAFDEEELTFQTSNKTTLSTSSLKAVVDKQEKKTSGIGLENVKKRLELLYPGEQHSLLIEHNGDMFEVVVTLRFHKK